MIRNVHTTTLRELVEQAERDLAGYRRLLDLAEREERAGTIYPDPMKPASAPWAPPQIAVDPLAYPPVSGREPYPTTVMPAIDGSTQSDPAAGEWLTRTSTCACGSPADPAKKHWANVCEDVQLGPSIDGSTLPPKQEAALGTIWSQHDQQAQTAKAREEEQQWRDA